MRKPFSRSRRRFFKKLALLGGLATLAGFAAQGFDVKKSRPKAIAESGKGYRLTPHIQTYYRTAGR